MTDLVEIVARAIHDSSPWHEDFNTLELRQKEVRKILSRAAIQATLEVMMEQTKRPSDALCTLFGQALADDVKRRGYRTGLLTNSENRVLWIETFARAHNIPLDKA